MSADLAHRIAAPAEAVHGIGYFPPEMRGFVDAGFRGWWHAYFAYRSAPLGPVDAPVVVAAFYNFAPRMIERAIPGAWEIMAPAEVLALHEELVGRALDRIWPDATPEIVEAGELAQSVMRDCDVTGRVLYAAHRDLPVPDDPRHALVHACTLLREFRGDGHNIALQAAGVDPVQSHLLMSGRGIGSAETIQRIRGWTPDEWETGAAALIERGWLDASHAVTDTGRDARRTIEAHTDTLAAEPMERLGTQGPRLVELLEPMAAELVSSGEIPGRWPPPTVEQ